MNQRVVPKFSLEAGNVFTRMPKSQQTTVVYLAQHLKDLVQQNKAILVDSAREPFVYRFHWEKKSLTVRFKILPQSHIPVLLKISID